MAARVVCAVADIRKEWKASMACATHWRMIGWCSYQERAMRYVVTSTKSVDQAAADLEEAIRLNGFGVLHQYDLKKTLAGKGVELRHECRILDVCNPQQAARVLSADMGLNVALPCRVSVYEEGGQTCIGMLKPTAMLAGLSDSQELKRVAGEVELAITRMIDAAR